MLTSFTPQKAIKPINQSQFYTYDCLRSRFPSLKKLRIPRTVACPWESGGLSMDAIDLSYEYSEADVSYHVPVIAFRINTDHLVCLFCDKGDEARVQILPDSQVPYARLVPRKRNARSVAKNRD